MTQLFRSFVVFAEMRTGSNLLEATLNRGKRVACFGEAFNPYMMGWPDRDELNGITRAERDENPHNLLRAILNTPHYLPGFRYYHDHDPRIFGTIMDDRTCAKIVLTRNPVHRYVSTVLTRQTNQWRLNKTPIPAPIHFDGAEFRNVVAEIEEFHLKVQQRLQATGQSAFWLGYDDLCDADVMTGLLHWLGFTDLGRIDPIPHVPQNPRELAQKVGNFAEMQADLAQFDPFQLHKIPNFEPAKGPRVGSFFACDAGRGLVFMPINGAPSAEIKAWLGAMGRVSGDFNQSSLRKWKLDHAGHRSFTVLRHPLKRAWAAFDALLRGKSVELRDRMRKIHRVPLPTEESLQTLSIDSQAELFEAFLDFLHRNLNAQTTLPTYPDWASQSELLAGFSRFGAPDMVLREAEIERDLSWLAATVGVDTILSLIHI